MDFDSLIYALQALPDGALLRLNDAGDLPAAGRDHTYQLTRGRQKKTGRAHRTRTSQGSCPDCALRGVCYASVGPISWHWQELSGDEWTAPAATSTAQLICRISDIRLAQGDHAGSGVHASARLDLHTLALAPLRGHAPSCAPSGARDQHQRRGPPCCCRGIPRGLPRRPGRAPRPAGPDRPRPGRAGHSLPGPDGLGHDL